MKSDNAQQRRKAPLATPSDLKSNAIKDLTGALNALVRTYSRFTSRRRIFTGTCRGRISAITTFCWTNTPIRSLP